MAGMMGHFVLGSGRRNRRRGVFPLQISLHHTAGVINTSYHASQQRERPHIDYPSAQPFECWRVADCVVGASHLVAEWGSSLNSLGDTQTLVLLLYAVGCMCMLHSYSVVAIN